MTTKDSREPNYNSPRFESELRSINIEDDMNKHLHNTYIVANLLLYVLEYETSL